MKSVIWIAVVVFLCVGNACAQKEETGLLPKDFKWQSGLPLVSVKPTGGDDWHAIKDPTIVQHEERWHMFCTVRGTKRSHSIIHFSFTDFKDAHKAEQTVLTCHPGFFCAPQVFYFTPQKKWYLICQGSSDSWDPKYGACYATTTDINDPGSWSELKPLGAQQADGKSGLDFWVICDDEKAHLFFTSLDGRMWREETSLEEFPGGWSKPELEIRGDIFEASHTYKIKGKDGYLTVVEAQNGHGWRYYKSYTAQKLEGPWEALAAEKEHAFASMRNVTHPAERWTDVISHIELLRSGHDEKLEVDPDNMRLIFQGARESERKGKKYGEIPWRLGMLEMRN